MAPERQKRNYIVSGELLLEQWEQLETTLGRLGVEMTIRPQGRAANDSPEIEHSPTSLTRRTFYEFALKTPGCSTRFAGRVWTQLAHIYAAKDNPEFAHGLWGVPYEFAGAPLEYENGKDVERFLDYNQLDYLTLESLGNFVQYVDEKIGRAGGFEQATLPRRMGPHTIEFLHALHQHEQTVGQTNRT